MYITLCLCVYYSQPVCVIFSACVCKTLILCVYYSQSVCVLLSAGVCFTLSLCVCITVNLCVYYYEPVCVFYSQCYGLNRGVDLWADPSKRQETGGENTARRLLIKGEKQKQVQGWGKRKIKRESFRGCNSTDHRQGVCGVEVE